MQVRTWYHHQYFRSLFFFPCKETSKKAVLSQIEQEDKFQEEEIVELALKDIGFI